MKQRTDVDVWAKPQDIRLINDYTGNIYQSLVVLSRRANQLAVEEKEELIQKLADFAPKTDNLEEVFDNREQIEISSHYERLPKPSLVAIQELYEGNIYFRIPSGEEMKETDTEK